MDAQAAFAKLFKCVGCRDIFDLDPISARMGKFWMTEMMLKFAMTGQNHQPFAVMIQPTDGIDIGDWDEVLEGAPLSRACGLCVSKLTQYVEWLVKKKIAMRHGERNGG